MAKDRAKDSRRVPSLGISEPISHVKVKTSGLKFHRDIINEETTKATNSHADGSMSKNLQEGVKYRQERGMSGTTPVVKINSGN